MVGGGPGNAAILAQKRGKENDTSKIENTFDNLTTFGSDIGEDEMERLMRIEGRKQMRMSLRNVACPDQLCPSPDRPMSQHSKK